jgi:ribosome-associated toxin RatA of RatAB toxin-antitoxin module
MQKNTHRTFSFALAAPLVAVAVAACLLTPQPAQAGERERLDKGELIIKLKDVKGSGLPETTMIGVVDSTPAKVWAFLSQCNKYKRHLPRTKESKELSRKGNVVVCKVVIDMPWPLDDLWSETRAVHTVKPNFYKRSWSLIKGTYTKNKGSWTVAPFDREAKRSKVTYKVHVVPTTGVPKWVQRKAAKSTLPDLMDALRKASK